MGKKSFIAGLLTEAFLEDRIGTTRYVVKEPTPVTRNIVVPTTTATVPTRGQYSTPSTTTYGCHGTNGRPKFSNSYVDFNTDDRIVVSYDTAVMLFRRIATAINTRNYSSDFNRRMGRELAYIISEGRSSGWKGNFRITTQNVNELREVCDKFNITVVLHGSDRQYEKLFEQLDAVLSSNDVVIA